MYIRALNFILQACTCIFLKNNMGRVSEKLFVQLNLNQTTKIARKLPLQLIFLATYFKKVTVHLSMSTIAINGGVH